MSLFENKELDGRISAFSKPNLAEQLLTIRLALKYSTLHYHHFLTPTSLRRLLIALQ